ncbi:hypothetical protein BDA99DRAFT_509560 [Phascolomyces articulosus]|uniref:Ubiquitin-like domain-containing protein n=1 Tax=Phascolomyces articulosus TaxID=60185 RepID=A0AAD5K098_9FUNG|nr:hypothetical protein BDA99DRAFT_509560 [Phascolomyces articulosus]
MPQGKLLYIRVRRNKSIVFLCYAAHDTIQNIKQKLCIAQPGCNKSPDQIRLYIRRSDQYSLLNDSDTVSSAGLESESDIYFVYQDEDGKWEEVHTEAYEPLDEGGPDELEEDAEMHADIPHTRKEKGKGRA